MKKIFLSILVGGILLSSCKTDPDHASGKVNEFVPVYALKLLHRGEDKEISSSDINGAVITGGIVVSDPSGNNFPKGYVAIQNNARGLTRGILIDIGDMENSFVPGDSITFKVIGSKMSKIGNSVQFKPVNPAESIKLISKNNPVNIATVSIGELITNFSNYENTLVKVTADATPTPIATDVYAGGKTLTGGGDAQITVFTQNNASFASSRFYPSATYHVIPIYGAANGEYGEEKQLRLRTLGDMFFPSGPTYPGWPESFESPKASFKGSYNMNTAEVPDNQIEMSTGRWKLYKAILGETEGRDRFNPPGKQSIRMQQDQTTTCYLQMMFDLPNGASKVTFWQGAYYTDVSSQFRLEYSTNGGTTWLKAVAVGRNVAEINTNLGGSIQETYLFDNLNGPVRFRILKLALGATKVPTILNGRLCIEDFAVYSKLD